MKVTRGALVLQPATCWCMDRPDPCSFMPLPRQALPTTGRRTSCSRCGVLKALAARFYFYNPEMVRRSLAIVFVLAASLGAQVPERKAAVLRSLDRIERELTRALARFESNEPGLLPGITFLTAQQSIRWLRAAADVWQTSDPGEGKEMLEALETIAETVHNAAPQAPLVLVRDVVEDLLIKANHCREHGLTNRPVVRVIPKRPGVGAVPDLKVLYVPKYRANRPDTEAKIFDKRSTPAEHRMTPGNYVIWAAEMNGSKSGTRQPVQIEGSMDRAIDVDAP
jgi:hypothetical protein